MACRAKSVRPLRSSAPLERVRGSFRRAVPAWDEDRLLAPDLEKARAFLSHSVVAREAASLA